ncbi:MAG: tRNA (guanine(26)-N(2))-dimethyltransferase [Haloarculaceae archaeon]
MHTEGAVELEIPEQPDAGAGDAVFFNPVQELNRDLTVATLRAARERADEWSYRSGFETYLDATAATGVRAVRAAADGWAVTACDVDPEAAALAERNLARNDLDGRVRQRDANALMHEQRFDVVDLDPFGTPVPFADAAVRSARHLLCVTATDTAPLCGAHFRSGVRTYGAVPRNTEYHAEMGLRVLLSALVRTAARYDVAATPVLSHVSDHYVRTYLRLEEGARAADARVDDLGYVDHCPECLYREHERALLATPLETCPHCGGTNVQTAGPLWLARPHDPGFVARVRDHLTSELGTAEEADRLLGRIASELDRPTHYDQHRLYKRWTEPAIAMDDFLDALSAAGHEVSRTHYGGTTFKTTADVGEIETAVRP